VCSCVSGCEVMISGWGKLVVDRIRGVELMMFRRFADKLSKRQVRGYVLG